METSSRVADRWLVVVDGQVYPSLLDVAGVRDLRELFPRSSVRAINATSLVLNEEAPSMAAFSAAGTEAPTPDLERPRNWGMRAGLIPPAFPGSSSARRRLPALPWKWMGVAVVVVAAATFLFWRPAARADIQPLPGGVRVTNVSDRVWLNPTLTLLTDVPGETYSFAASQPFAPFTSFNIDYQLFLRDGHPMPQPFRARQLIISIPGEDSIARPIVVPVPAAPAPTAPKPKSPSFDPFES